LGALGCLFALSDFLKIRQFLEMQFSKQNHYLEKSCKALLDNMKNLP